MVVLIINGVLLIIWGSTCGSLVFRKLSAGIGVESLV